MDSGLALRAPRNDDRESYMASSHPKQPRIARLDLFGHRVRREYPAECKRRRTFRDLASGDLLPHRVPRFLSRYRLSARQRSGGKFSQTSRPFSTAVSVGVVTRSEVPSGVSTM
ncbi:hypothetical protein chiPu_0028564 [Chiloscyllium punctatum]|uniref:Uncharacterized protein n=1 Tax=Chiloscyllium punctatum TaxID=137246 RepID=A0A401TPM1_CHIPU|nr:hypothetical protein [Chiloscyllium punctatum]